jgi:Coenzyme PQQ synthesis protein D (PqqD)
VENHGSHLRTISNSDGAAILDTKLGKILTLNSTGAYVWGALQRGEEIGRIAAGLARETGEKVETLERDVRDFVDTLKAQHLLAG